MKVKVLCFSSIYSPHTTACSCLCTNPSAFHLDFTGVAEQHSAREPVESAPQAVWVFLLHLHCKSLFKGLLKGLRSIYPFFMFICCHTTSNLPLAVAVCALYKNKSVILLQFYLMQYMHRSSYHLRWFLFFRRN